MTPRPTLPAPQREEGGTGVPPVLTPAPRSKKHTLLLSTLALLAALHPLRAEVVRPAPAFHWIDSTGKAKSSAALRGQPLVLVIAQSPTQRLFRAQVGQLQKIYERFAANGVLCIAAFSSEPGIIRSNIPFLTVPDGAATAAAFDTPAGFSISVIGEDGNLDYIGNRVLPAQRIYDIIDNSFARQKKLRRN